MGNEPKYRDVLKCNQCGTEIKWYSGDYHIENYTIVPRRIIVSDKECEFIICDKECEFIICCTKCKIFNKVIVPIEKVKSNKQVVLHRTQINFQVLLFIINISSFRHATLTVTFMLLMAILWTLSNIYEEVNKKQL